MTGFDYVVVELNYKRPQNTRSSEAEPFYKQYVEITSCGKRGAMYGEGTKNLEPAR